MVSDYQYDPVGESLKIIKENLPSIITMITINPGKIKFRTLIFTLILPLIINFLKIQLDRVSQRRITQKYPAKLKLELNEIVSGWNTPIKSIMSVCFKLHNANFRVNAISGNVSREKGKEQFCVYTTKDEFVEIVIDKKLMIEYYFPENIPNELRNKLLGLLDKLHGQPLALSNINNEYYLLGRDSQLLTDFYHILCNCFAFKKDVAINRYINEVTDDHRTSRDLISKRGLDKIFLPESSQIKQRLIEWKEDEDFYKKYERPHKLAILLYGKPGTGKTSMVTAIANYLQYNICKIKIEDPSETNWVFKTIEENPNTVFLIDEIDRVLKELDTPNETQEISKDEQTGITTTKINTIKNAKEKFVKKMMEILENERLNNVVIIFTTNEPLDWFDPAMIRAGRIDYKEELTYADAYQFKQIHQEFLECPVPEDFDFWEGQWSTSYVINEIVIPFRKTPEKIYEALKQVL